jgi:hypothetical protein
MVAYNDTHEPHKAPPYDSHMLLACVAVRRVTSIERRPSVAIQDPFNPAARAYVFEQLQRNYMRYGINLFWLDEAEPERHQQDIGIRYLYHAGTDSEVI